MTLESLHFVESNSQPELDPTEMLILQKIEIHRDIGRLSIELSRLNQQLNEKILESIQLNQALAEAGVDKETLAGLLHAPVIQEGSPSYESELYEPAALQEASGF